ncbi:MAG: type II secretion system F family protein [Acidimicrobiaceae bacterium]|nr:type II secretion system F family protein [Acidimicrobiaceae bacterium]
MTALLAGLLVLAALLPDLSAARPRGRVAARLTPRLPLLGRLRSVVQRWAGRNSQAEAVPQALELTARALRSGASLLTALECAAAELSETDLGRLTRRVRGGLSLSEALDDWVEGLPERQTAAALLVLGHTSGAAMAASLDNAAESLRQRQALNDEIRALTAQTRTSGLVVAAAPAGFALIIALVDPSAFSGLWASPLGWASLGLGLVLEGLGLWWMSRLCRSVGCWS